MREHGPEAQHRRRRNVHPKLRQIALDEPIDRLHAPCGRIGIVDSEKSRRESAAQPKTVQRSGADFRQIERRHLDDLHPSQQRFASLTQQLRAGAAEQQVLTRPIAPVDQHPQDRKQLRGTLHLIDDDQALQMFQRGSGLRQARSGGWILEIEIVRVAERQELPGERGLSGLARPDQHYRPRSG